ncbi:MAG: conjugal transfer protein, partial [Lactococcus lactis]|nr:conjugal transfer protein [Lactococcus lactis]
VPPKINGGKETIDDMSLIVGMYDNYQVTKTGNLVGILEVSGINLDLLNDNEQQDVFNDYGAFLMSTLGEGVDDTLQFIEPTIPVNMTAYINGLKRKYLDLKLNHPEQEFKINLLASYLDHFTTVQNSKNMTTKQHLLIVKVKIKDKSVESLDLAVNNLDEKINQVKRDLENALADFDLTAKILPSQEVLEVLKNLINFKG